MNFKKYKLANGIRVLVVPMPSLESATVAVWVKTGSRNEEDRVAGISHFLEHMVFKGSKKRPSAKDISEAVDAIGGEFNAATSKEWTTFYIKSSVKAVETAFDVLSDMVLNPILKESEIEREKGVICEEIAMYEDTPIYQIGDVFERSLFEGNNLGRDVIGNEKTVKSIKRNDFISYRDTYYNTDNIIIVIAGGISKNKALELSKIYFGGLKEAKKKKEKEQKYTSDQSKPRVYLKSKKNDQAHLVIGFLSKERGNKDQYTEAVASTILGGGMSSRMFTEVREKRGLAYSVRVYTDHFKDCGEVATYAGVDPKKADDAIKVILNEYYALKGKKKITPKELKKAKEYLKGQIALSLEDTKSVDEFFAVRALFGLELKTPEEVFSLLDKVSIKDVYGYARKTFIPEKLNLAVIGPFEDVERFKKLLK